MTFGYYFKAMTTTIENNELNAELQELYLKSKHWISDLGFLESELEFLKKLFGRTSSPLIKNDDFEKITEILIKTAKIEKAQLDLKSDIVNYLHKLEPLIIESKQNFDISLIETHAQLELDLSEILLAFKSVKTMVFDLTKQGLKKYVLA